MATVKIKIEFVKCLVYIFKTLHYKKMLQSISLKTEKPMIMKRKDAKSYGTKNLIEGIYKHGDKCLVIEDVITSGSSIIETVQVGKKIFCFYGVFKSYFKCFNYF